MLCTLSFLAAYTVPAAYAETYDQCLLRGIKSADGTLTLQALRAQCLSATGHEAVPADNGKSEENENKNLLADRIKSERATRNNPFTISPHKPNYILPLSYATSIDHDHWGTDNGNLQGHLSPAEIKFQISIKAPVATGIFQGKGDLYVAYTNTSWWQAYNIDNSSPFRETNHEPEAFLIFPMHQNVFGLNLRATAVGISHQSNGRAGGLSRGWNRVYANFILEKDNFYMSFKPWWRIPEKKKEYPGDAEGDDNPDIVDYMGYGELHFGYKMGDYNLGLMVRNNLRSENKGAIQLDWTFPINQRFKGYVQYFNGYGESLIDYNDSVSRISAGIMLTDWL